MNRVYDTKYICGSATIDRNLNIKTATDEFFEFLGENALYSLARTIHPDDIDRIKSAMDELTKIPNNMVTVRIVRYDGEYRWMLLSMKSSKIEENGIALVDIDMEDLNTFKERIEVLQNGNELYGEYFGLMEYLLVSYDVTTDKIKIFMLGSHEIDYYNGTLTDWEKEHLEQKLVATEGIAIFNEVCNAFREGTPNFEFELKMSILDKKKKEWCMIKGKTIIDGSKKKHVIATLSGINHISKRKNIESTLSTTKDPGTDIINKKAVTNYVTDILSRKPSYPVTIAIIDIDDFKHINDTYGHMVGDKVLYRVAQILKKSVGNKGVAGRIGGDEMIIVLENMSTEEDLRTILRTIRVNVEWLFRDEDTDMHITCSIGSATYPYDAESYDDLFKLADKSLYLAKEKGKNRYVIYTKEIHEKYVKELGEAVVRKEQLYKYNKLGISNDILASMYNKDLWDIQRVAEKIGMAFELDSIYAYYLDENRREVLWGMKSNSPLDIEYFRSDSYMGNFDKSNTFVCDQTKFLEKRFDTAFNAFHEMKIFNCIQQCVGSLERPKVILSFNKNKESKKWTELDVTLLSILGNAIGVKLENDR